MSGSGVPTGETSATEAAEETSTGTSSTEESTGGEEPRRCPETMAFVPGGMFEPAELSGNVTLEAFCIDITPVTMSAYLDCDHCAPAESDDPSESSMYCNADHAFRGSDPANCLDALQAEYYCEAQEKTLPDEFQWEWAARGGEAAQTYPWGDEAPTADDDPERLCWAAARGNATWPNRPQGTCVVGEFDQQSDHPFGIEDMSGNIWHWTTTEGSGPATRVVRGGGWDNTLPERMTTGFRNPAISETTRHAALGFRCVSEPLNP